MDWVSVKKIAYGALGLNPIQLGKLTHVELEEMWEGYLWNESRYYEKMSVLASWITAPHLKKPVDPKKFYDPDKNDPNKRQTRKKTNEEESKEMINQLKIEMGVE